MRSRLLVAICIALPTSGLLAQRIDTIELRHEPRIKSTHSDLHRLHSYLIARYPVGECTNELPIGGSKYLISVLKRDLKIQELDSIIMILALRLTIFGNSEACITVQEWVFSSKQMAAVCMAKLKAEAEKPVYYEPPSNWFWIQSGVKLFFVYSESYDANSAEMNTVRDALYELD